MILGLKLPTDPRWVDIAEKNIEDILVDHAYCEQKAATMAISLIVNYYRFPELVDEMNALVKEEWSHFDRVLQELKKRGYQLGPPRVDEYAIMLQKLVRKGGDITRQLMDKLLINALIEARSAERFKLLSENIADMELREFYRELMISEAGHYRTFLDMAEKFRSKEEVRERWQELLNEEAKIMAELSIRADRMH